MIFTSALIPSLVPSLTLCLAPSPPAPTAKVRLAKPVQLLVDGAPIDMAKQSGHAGPALYDRDRNGKPMLIVGSLTGEILAYFNSGTAEVPVYLAPMKLGLKGPVSPPLKFNSW